MSFGDDGGSAGDADGGACASSTAQASPIPVDLVFMFDRSGSMGDNNKWTSCSAGLEAFFGDPKSAGLSASLQFFEQPDACNVSAYATPLVAMTALPNAAPFDAAINATQPNGGTPTLPAIQGAYQYAAQLEQQNMTAKVAVVLVTDGEPNDCNSSVQSVASAAQAAGPKTPTYVIGIGNVTNLDAIAQAGGTQSAFIVSTGNPQQTATDFQNALSTIKGSTLSCEYQVPSASNGQMVDYNQVNVVFTPSNGPADTLTYNKDCGGSGQGWHYDNPQNPTKIEICPASCTTVQGDAGGTLAIQVGCATKGGVQ